MSGMIVLLLLIIASAYFNSALGKHAKRNGGAKKNSPFGEFRPDITKILPFGEAPEPDEKVGEHSHDRLDDIPDDDHDAEEHWKQQLDGFLKAGLIDRAEYKVLYEQRKKCYYADENSAHRY